jgi:hypothetical protein
MSPSVCVQSWSAPITMKKPIPARHASPAALHPLLHAESAVPRHHRVQTRDLLQTQLARTRRQVARRLGVSRQTVGRWLAAYAVGGSTRMLTIAKAPGQPPVRSPAIRQARRERLAPPEGFASDTALWPWLQHEDGLSIA